MYAVLIGSSLDGRSIRVDSFRLSRPLANHCAYHIVYIGINFKFCSNRDFGACIYVSVGDRLYGKYSFVFPYYLLDSRVLPHDSRQGRYLVALFVFVWTVFWEG